MKLPLKLNRRIARLLMAVVLLTQWVLPASAYAAAPAAQAGVSVSSAMPAAPSAPGMPCHDPADCVTHCSQADQVRLDHAQLVAVPVSTAVWHVAVPQAPALAFGARPATEPHPGASPPLSILYCSLLN